MNLRQSIRNFFAHKVFLVLLTFLVAAAALALLFTPKFSSQQPAPAYQTLHRSGEPSVFEVNPHHGTTRLAPSVRDAFVAGAYIPPVPALVTFQPGGTANPSSNLYSDFPTLAASVGQYKGPQTIFCDVTFSPTSNTCVIPAGTWNFASSYLTFDGLYFSNTSPGYVTISFGTGAFIPNLRGANNVILSADGTTVPVQISSGSNLVTFELHGHGSITSTGSQPFITFSTGGALDRLVIAMEDGANLSGSSGSATSVAQITGTGYMFLLTYGSNNIDTPCIGAPTAAQVLFEANASASYQVSQPGILDTGMMPAPIFLFGQASNLPYTPAVPANWTSPPTEVAQALDDLAAKDAGKSAAEVTPVVTNLTSDIAVTVVDPTFVFLVSSKVDAGPTGLYLLQGLATGISVGAPITPRLQILVDDAGVNYLGNFGPQVATGGAGVQVETLGSYQSDGGSHIFTLQASYSGGVPGWSVQASSFPLREGAVLTVTPY